MDALKDRIEGVMLSIAKTSLMKKVLYEVDISRDAWYIEPEVISEIFPRIPWVLRYNNATRKRGGSGRIHRWLSRKEIDYPDREGEYVDSTVWKGIKIFINLSVREKDRMHMRTIRLYTANSKNSEQILRNFAKYMISESDRIKRTLFSTNYNRVVRTDGGNFVSNLQPKTTRSFNDVFVPSDIRDKLISAINRFLSSQKWYVERNIPYHFGILLHGPAGTGKSSITQALMNNWINDAYVLTSDVVRWAFMSNVYNDWMCENTYGIPRFIIAEDIDTAVFCGETRDEMEARMDEKTGHFAEMDRNDIFSQYQQAKATLGNVLNFMDGLGSPENVVYIFTTNHIDHLDPALIRPGRIDLIVEIGYATDETFSEFLEFHYGKKLPENKHIKPEQTFAALQTKVMVGKSFEELVEEACESEDHKNDNTRTVWDTYSEKNIP